MNLWWIYQLLKKQGSTKFIFTSFSGTKITSKVSVSPTYSWDFVKTLWNFVKFKFAKTNVGKISKLLDANDC